MPFLPAPTLDVAFLYNKTQSNTEIHIVWVHSYTHHTHSCPYETRAKSFWCMNFCARNISYKLITKILFCFDIYFFLIYCDENLIFSSLHHYTHIVSVGLTFSCVWRIGRHGGDYEHDDQPTAAVREAHAYITSASSTSAAIEHKVVQPVVYSRRERS